MDNIINANKDSFIFAHCILGIKGMRYHTLVLLVNNETENTLDLIYSDINEPEKSLTIKIPKTDVNNITYTSKMRVQTTEPDITENETKSMLLSAAVFGGNPTLQVLGAAGFNEFFDSLSDYSKVDFEAYYEITIEALYNGEATRIVFVSDNDPRTFIEEFKK